MDVRKEAMIISAVTLVIQLGAAIALYFFGVVMNLDRLLIIIVLIGIMISRVCFIMPKNLSQAMTPDPPMMVAGIFFVCAGLSAFWVGIVESRFLPFSLVVVTFLVWGASFCGAHDLRVESSGKESLRPLFVILSLPQFCILVATAALMLS